MTSFVLLILCLIFFSSYSRFNFAITLSGDKTSYLKFENIPFDENNKISFQFKPASDHGLLLYLDSSGLSKDFIYIYLIDNQVAATVCINASTNYFSSNNFAHKSSWNNITLEKRDTAFDFSFNEESTSISLVAENGKIQTGEPFSSGLFIGGLPNNIHLNKLSFQNVYYKPHLSGDIHNVINDIGNNWLVSQFVICYYSLISISVFAL